MGFSGLSDSYGGNWGTLCRYPGNRLGTTNHAGGSIDNFGATVTFRCKPPANGRLQGPLALGELPKSIGVSCPSVCLGKEGTICRKEAGWFSKIGHAPPPAVKKVTYVGVDSGGSKPTSRAMTPQQEALLRAEAKRPKVPPKILVEGPYTPNSRNHTIKAPNTGSLGCATTKYFESSNASTARNLFITHHKTGTLATAAFLMQQCNCPPGSTWYHRWMHPRKGDKKTCMQECARQRSIVFACDGFPFAMHLQPIRATVFHCTSLATWLKRWRPTARLVRVARAHALCALLVRTPCIP